MKRLTYRLEDQCGNPTDSIILESDLIPLKSSEKSKIILSRLAAIEDILGDEYDLDHLRKLAQADREGRCVVLCEQNESLSAIRELYKLLFDVNTAIKNKDFSIFRHVGIGAPEITIPFLSKLYWLEDRYDEIIYVACKEEEVEAALRREQNG